MLTLEQIYQLRRNGDWPDKGSVHSYLEVYQHVLAPYRQSAQNVLEIGILGGESLKMWSDYFTRARVQGVDCSLCPLGGQFDLRPMIAEGYQISILDATDPVQVENQFKSQTFDVIVEDASHLFEHQLSIYSNFKDRLSDGGIYIIEDIADLDVVRPQLEQIDPDRLVEIIDRRSVKGRFDDVLVVITD